MSRCSGITYTWGILVFGRGRVYSSAPEPQCTWAVRGDIGVHGGDGAPPAVVAFHPFFACSHAWGLECPHRA